MERNPLVGLNGQVLRGGFRYSPRRSCSGSVGYASTSMSMLTDLTDANLFRAYLKDARLEGAILRGANLEQMEMTGACVAGACFERARAVGTVRVERCFVGPAPDAALEGRAAL